MQPNPKVQEPVKDSFTKYMANQRPIDLTRTTFRILWSKEKVAREEEEKRQLREKVKRDRRKRVMKSLGAILDDDTPPKIMTKSKDSLYKEFQAQPGKPIEISLAPSLPIPEGDNTTGKIYADKF